MPGRHFARPRLDAHPRRPPAGCGLRRLTSRRVNDEWHATLKGELKLLVDGKLTPVARTGVNGDEASVLGQINYYGHHGWPWLVAVSP